MIAGCGDGPFRAEDFFPDISGIWIAETDFRLESNTCPYSASQSERFAGNVLNITQDTGNPARILIGTIEGTLKPNGNFKTRIVPQEGTFIDVPGGFATYHSWFEGEFQGHILNVRAILEITHPDPVCEVIYSLRANRTAGG